MTKKDKPLKQEEVLNLIAQVGRAKDDGLPPASSGAEILRFTAVQTEKGTVRETVRFLKQADMNRSVVTGYSTIGERKSDGHLLFDEEKGFMAQAKGGNSVIIAQFTPFFENSLEK